MVRFQDSGLPELKLLIWYVVLVLYFRGGDCHSACSALVGSGCSRAQDFYRFDLGVWGLDTLNPKPFFLY